MHYNAIPGVVYTNPEVAGAGLTEAEAARQGLDCAVARLPMAYAGRFVAENEGGEGFCKILVGAKHGEIIGVHMMGNTSSEIIYGCCLAIEMEMTVEDLKQIIYPHPTVSEIIKESVFAVK
jgi:dihydrolipoamide dehydrogenase